MMEYQHLYCNFLLAFLLRPNFSIEKNEGLAVADSTGPLILILLIALGKIPNHLL